MRHALRFPSRWAGQWRTLAITTALSVALGACSTMFGAREGTIEYPGSGAPTGAAAVYVVKEKDTVDAIARRYGVPSQAIIDRNRLQQPYTIRPGQTLEVPGARLATTDSASSPATPPTMPVATAPASVKREPLPPPASFGETPKAEAAKPDEPRPGAPAPGQPTPLSPPAADKSKSAASPRFAWPVKGKILVPYGGSAGGQKNDGIDIQADAGEPVKAADGGTVVYAGSEVAHLGNLLLIQHPGGYITAYGNNDALLVKKGDEVKKGQTIAKAGNSGGAPSPRLHFEVRRGGSKTIDPTSVLPP